MNMKRLLRFVVLAFIAVGLPACGTTLIPTPYVMYGEAGRQQYAKVPESLRSADVPVLYATDRGVDRTTSKGPHYGYKRNRRFTYGVATATLGDGVSWDELVEDSTGPRRKQTYKPRVAKIEEAGGFTPVAGLMEVVEGRPRARADAAEVVAKETAALHAHLERWIERYGSASTKDAVVFIHGFNNTFDDAILRLAMAWHMGGRQGVPIVYTWPAGSGGLLGYFFDRESGEFTIVHLKRFILALAQCPRIERIHIIAHSRGTDVATTALRELNAEIRGALGLGYVAGLLNLTDKPGGLGTRGPMPWQLLRIATLVLAAPDLDMEVFQQRFFGENVLYMAERTAVYVSPEDAAIGFARKLFGSKDRIGTLKADDLTPEQHERLAQVACLELINCKVSGGSSHAYLAQHPSALSDLILLLRERATPGEGGKRPLSKPARGFWEMGNDYLKPKAGVN